VNDENRFTVSDEQASTRVGELLISALVRISADGKLSNSDITALSGWLNKATALSDIPGLHFLREEIDAVLEDGIISEPERRLLIKSILKVLPANARELAELQFTAAEKQANSTALDKATPKQAECITQLGGVFNPGFTQLQADQTIDQLYESRPTPRQLMILRFWDRASLEDKSVEAVAKWLDAWYSEDHHRRIAWTQWHKQNPHCTLEDVPRGAGISLLRQLKASQFD
jgi:hypothetical protein